jgi:RND family efflux transporter MFP subunit
MAGAAVFVGAEVWFSRQGKVETAQAVQASAPVPAPAPAMKPPAISVIPADKRMMVESVVVTGSLMPREEVVVGTDIEGLRLLTLAVDVGDTVKAGQVIATLDDDSLKIQLLQNESQIAWAEAAIAQAESTIAQAEAAQVEAAAALERAKPLKDKGVISQEVLDQRISAARSADARLDVAKHGLRLAELEKRVREANRKDLELKLSKTAIKAPTDGVVLQRNGKIGSITAGNGEPLFRLARDGKIELHAQVTEATLGHMKEGMKVAVTPSGLSEAIEGEIRLVSPQVDRATRLGEVRVAMPADGRLRAGSFARGRVELARREGVSVPLSAVNTERGKSTLQVVKDGKVETRKVVTGLTDEARIEIVEGLAAGEQVVAKAGTFVRNGDLVTPVAAKDEESQG